MPIRGRAGIESSDAGGALVRVVLPLTASDVMVPDTVDRRRWRAVANCCRTATAVSRAAVERTRCTVHRPRATTAVSAECAGCSLHVRVAVDLASLTFPALGPPGWLGRDASRSPRQRGNT